jgi:hypothetical protein
MRVRADNVYQEFSELLDGAANLREHVVGVRPNQPDRTDDYHENHRQHNRVFRDVLAALIVPELLQKFSHGLLFSSPM